MSSQTRKDRLRWVVLLCHSFTRNLAYYRVGQTSEYSAVFDHAKNSAANFWRMANGNSIDICVLEWCKLFADSSGKHHWNKIVENGRDFEKTLT